jgi:hypothetical protein
VAQETNRALFLPLESGQLLHNEPGQICIALPSGFGTSRLQQRITELETVCTTLFGQPTQVSIEIRETTNKSSKVDSARRPGTKERKERDEALRLRRQSALEHPALNEAIRILGAEILEIRPVEGENNE